MRGPDRLKKESAEVESEKISPHMRLISHSLSHFSSLLAMRTDRLALLCGIFWVL